MKLPEPVWKLDMTWLLLCTWNQLNHFIFSDTKVSDSEVHRSLKNCGFSVQNLLYVTFWHIVVERGSWIFEKCMHSCLFLVPMLRMGNATLPVAHILSWHILGQLYYCLFLVPTSRLGRAITPVPHIFAWHVPVQLYLYYWSSISSSSEVEFSVRMSLILTEVPV